MRFATLAYVGKKYVSVCTGNEIKTCSVETLLNLDYGRENVKIRFLFKYFLSFKSILCSVPYRVLCF